MTTIYIAVRYSTPTDFAIFGPYASEGEAQKSATDSMYPALGFTESFDIGNVLERHEKSYSGDLAALEKTTYYCFSKRAVDVPKELESKLLIEKGYTNAWDEVHSLNDDDISEHDMIVGILNHLEPEYAQVLCIQELHEGTVQELLQLGIFDRVCRGRGKASRYRLLALTTWTATTSLAITSGKWPDAQDAGYIEDQFWRDFVIDKSPGPDDCGESYNLWSGLNYH